MELQMHILCNNFRNTILVCFCLDCLKTNVCNVIIEIYVDDYGNVFDVQLARIQCERNLSS